MRLIFFNLFIAIALISNAQSRLEGIKVGIGFFGTSYNGDLNYKNKEKLHRFYPGASLSLSFVTPRLLSPLIEVGFGRFDSQNRGLAEVNGIQPNTFVKTSFFNANIQLRARILNKKSFSPTLGLGIGLLSFTPKSQDGNNYINITSTRKPNETYGNTTANVPLHLGLNYKLNTLFQISLDYQYFITFTDYLDNIGQLGTKKGNDSLHSLQFSLYFVFANKSKATRM